MARGKVEINDADAAEKTRKKNARLASLRAFGKYLYDSENGKIMARNGREWCRILIFYIFFYGALAAFFAICISVFLFKVIDEKVPTLRAKETILKNFPGMGFRPCDGFKTEENLIPVKFDYRDSSTYEPHVKNLKEFLGRYYNQTESNLVDCKSPNSTLEGNQTCRIPMELHGPCSPENDFGFKEGKPCILLKLNKIYGWIPETYGNFSCPANSNADCNADYVDVTCGGRRDFDTPNIGPPESIKFYPAAGFGKQYYPYLNQPNYLQPIIFVQFTEFRRNIYTHVWCKAWANNIYHNKNDQAGSVSFGLKIDGENETSTSA